MKRILLGMVAMVLITGHMFGQWTVGVRAGVTGTNVQAAEAIEMITPNFRSMPSITAGVSARYEWSEKFSTVAEAYFGHRGFRVSEHIDMDLLGIDLPIGIQFDTRIGHVSVPFMAQYHIGSGALSGFVGLGPELSYATHARVKARGQALLNISVLDRPVSLDAINYQRFDIGAVGVAGAEYDLDFGHIFIDARFHHGFNDLVQVPVIDTNVKSYTVGVGLGLRVAI